MAGGFLGRELSARGFTELVGLDREPTWTARTKQYYRRHRLVDLEAQEPLADLGEFDFIICSDVLEHLREPLEQLRRLVALLKPGGQVIVSLPNVANWTVRCAMLLGYFEYGDRGLLDRGHLRFFTHRTARAILRDAGLTIHRVYATPIPVSYVLDGQIPTVIGRGLDRTYYALTVLWKTLFAYQFVFVATREIDTVPQAS